jgi:hypothetical protein
MDPVGFRCGVCKRNHAWNEDPARAQLLCFEKVFRSFVKRLPEGFLARGLRVYDPRGIPFDVQTFFYDVLGSNAPLKTLANAFEAWRTCQL